MIQIYPFFALGYTVAMAVYWLGVFFIIYHLIRFGVSTLPKKLSVVFLTGAMVLSLITTLLFIQIDFSSFNLKGSFCCEVNPEELLNSY